MTQAKPEVSCNNTTFVYLIEASALQAAKRQVQKVAGKNPVLFIETHTGDGMVELTVMAASLTPSQGELLESLQDDVSFHKIGEADFGANQVSFG